MKKLSQRLRRLADMVTEGFAFADIGTDHGYVPIALLTEKKIPRAFAMDIKEGPLLLAKEHIKAAGLCDYITLRRSDGMAALAAGEADSILIAGMGGAVMRRILADGADVLAAAKELILQPQSEIADVREYLYQEGYSIDREDIVFEHGIYYPMMHLSPGRRKHEPHCCNEEEWQAVLRYGELRLMADRETFFAYLRHKILQYETLLAQISHLQGAGARERKEEIALELFYAKCAWEDGMGGTKE